MMSPDQTPQQLCVSEVIRRARELSYRDSLTMLRGLLLLAGDADEVHALRAVVMQLDAADDQLELIAGPQMRLPLNGGDGK